MLGRLPCKKYICYTINEAHKQYKLLDTIFNYTFYLGPPGKHLQKNKENLLHVVTFGDLNIDIFLEVQDKKYS